MTGVALMIAITVMLVVIVVPLVFMVSGNPADSQPSTDFAFSYSEDVNELETDSFGNTRSDANASGLVVIVFDDGDAIDLDQLEIAGAASGGALADADEYAGQSEFVPGQTVTVWANRGDTVQLLWTGEDGESAILDEFPIRPVGDLPVYVPEPDVGCGWVEDRTPGDLTVDGEVVRCDLDDFSVDSLTIQNDGAVIGNITVSNDVTLSDGATYLDDVTAGGDLVADSGSVIDGDVDVDGSLSLTDSKINGHATAGGAVDLTRSTITDGLDAGSTVDLVDSAIEETTEATGALSLDASSILGTATSGDTITLDGESEIRQDVSLTDVASDLICNDGDQSTVAGVGCEEYKAPVYEVTILDSNDPVEDETLYVNASVENTGYETGSQDVELAIDGDVKDTNASLSLDAGQEAEVTLSWDTAVGDNGSYDAVVSSDDDADDATVLVADQDRDQTGITFEIDGEETSLEINRDDTVPYTATAEFDDGSTDDVTGDVNVTVVSGDPANVTIDESNAEITGDDPGTVTIEANDTNGGDSYTDTVDLTVRSPMDERIDLVAKSTGSPSVSVDLENVGPGDVEIDAIAVDSATTQSGNADKVDNDGNSEVVGGGTYVDTLSIEIGGNSRSFNDAAVIADGAVETFDVQEFRQDNGKTRNVDDFVFTLYFSDGSEKTFDTSTV